MKLDNLELHNLYKQKDIHFLYHANSVATAITFIKQGGLLSRGAVESKGLYQTPQSSDAIDQVFNVWNDIFLDTIDLHGYFPRQNLYGPISFQFPIDFLLLVYHALARYGFPIIPSLSSCEASFNDGKERR